jgi:hypothetical protein
MSEAQSPTQPQAAQQPRPGFRVRELPYVLLLVLAVTGIAYTSLSPDASVAYWKILAPVFAIVCIVSQWSRVPAGGVAKTRLVIVQLLHWGAFLLTILILFLPDVQKMMNSQVSAQIVLYLLALSTFLAGLYSTSWQLVAVGVLMALAVPAIAFLERSVLLVVVIAAAVLVVIGAYVFQRRRRSGDALKL